MKDFNIKGIDQFPFLASYSKKKASNFALARDIMDYYDSYHSEFPSNRKSREELRENYDLYNGRWPQINKRKHATFSFHIQGEKINLGNDTDIDHYPIVDRVAKSIYGDVVLNPLIPVVVDTSSRSVTMRKKAKAEAIKAVINDTIITPIRNQVTQQYILENNIQDVYGLSIEQQQQAQADIEKRVQQITPKDILNRMKSYRTPEEEMAQILIEDVIRDLKVKEKFDLGAEHAICQGVEAYRIWIRNNHPMLETLSIDGLRWGAADDVEFIEDGEYAKYDRYLKLSDVINRHGMNLKRKDIEELLDMYGPIPSYAENSDPQYGAERIKTKFLHTMADNPELQSKINAKTREGQQQLLHLYSAVADKELNGYGIRESFITWKWQRMLYRVTRIEQGEEEIYLRDEHYKKSPRDVKVEKVYVPQVWQGTIVGEPGSHRIYLDVGPVPFQYNNFENPFDVKLPIHGCIYNTISGNSKNLSHVDLGKPWQYRYNVLMKRIDEFEATNIGRVLLGTANMKPKDWTWEEFFRMIAMGKFVPTRTRGDGVNPIDAQFIKSIDLSNALDIGRTLDQLNYIEQKIISSMHYSQAKLGAISPYTTATNNQSNLAATDRQLMKFFDKHRQVQERVLNTLFHTARIAYKDNNIKKSVLFDDFTIASMELDGDMLERLDSINLYIVNNIEENQKKETVRANLLNLIQNTQQMSIKAFIGLVDARSISEMYQIAEDVEEAQMQALQAQIENEERREKQMQEWAAQFEEIKSMLRRAERAEEDETRLQVAELETSKFSKQFDINENNQNDLVEGKLAELASEERKHAEEMEFKREKLKEESRLEEKKLDKQD